MQYNVTVKTIKTMSNVAGCRKRSNKLEARRVGEERGTRTEGREMER